jgi:hypothetical protein
MSKIFAAFTCSSQFVLLLLSSYLTWICTVHTDKKKIVLSPLGKNSICTYTVYEAARACEVYMYEAAEYCEFYMGAVRCI